MEKLNLTQQKHTFTKQKKCTTTENKQTSSYAMVVHGRPKTPKNTSFLGHPAPRGRTAPIF